MTSSNNNDEMARSSVGVPMPRSVEGAEIACSVENTEMARSNADVQMPRKSVSVPVPRTSIWWELVSLAARIAAIISVALLVFTFVYGVHYNIDPSMHPAVKDGDLVFYSRFDKDYRAGDLLILGYQGQSQVRRVIATAGDTVDITEDGLVINGALQQEREITRRTERYAEGIEFPITLTENEVFVLGDAREDVTDSRMYGCVDTEDTEGKVVTIIRRRNL